MLDIVFIIVLKFPLRLNTIENTDRFVATISKSSLTSLDFNASALFFKRFENRDSIAPNLESRTL